MTRLNQQHLLQYGRLNGCCYFDCHVGTNSNLVSFVVWSYSYGKKIQRYHVVYPLPLRPHSSKIFPIQILICVWSCGFDSGHISSDSTFECDLHMTSSSGGYILSKLTVGIGLILELPLHHYTSTYQSGMWYYVGSRMVNTWH